VKVVGAELAHEVQVGHDDKFETLSVASIKEFEHDARLAEPAEDVDEFVKIFRCGNGFDAFFLVVAKRRQSHDEFRG